MLKDYKYQLDFCKQNWSCLFLTNFFHKILRLWSNACDVFRNNSYPAQTLFPDSVLCYKMASIMVMVAQAWVENPVLLVSFLSVTMICLSVPHFCKYNLLIKYCSHLETRHWCFLLLFFFFFFFFFCFFFFVFVFFFFFFSVTLINLWWSVKYHSF